MVNRADLHGLRCAILATTIALFASSCGDDGQPVPGYVDPCQAPVAALLDCPAAPAGVQQGAFDERDACEKLVQCGILADEWLSGDGSHRLDYAWCLQRLRRASRPTDPCAQTPYTAEQSTTTIRCIETLPCAALGLPLEQKRRSTEQTPELDRYRCPNGEQRRTATVCDQGLLSY